MKTYSVTITPAWMDLFSRIPKVEGVKIKHLQTDINYGEGISVFWVQSDLEGLNLSKELLKIFGKREFTVLEVS